MLPNVAAERLLEYADRTGVRCEPRDLVVRSRTMEDSWWNGTSVQTTCSVTVLMGGILRGLTCVQSVRRRRGAQSVTVSEVSDRSFSIRAIGALRRYPDGPALVIMNDGTWIYVTEEQRQLLARALAGGGAAA